MKESGQSGPWPSLASCSMYTGGVILDLTAPTDTKANDAERGWARFSLHNLGGKGMAHQANSGFLTCEPKELWFARWVVSVVVETLDRRPVKKFFLKKLD